MKKLILMMIMIILMMLLCGCDANKIPRVALIKNDWRFDNINLPLRDGYVFAEDIFYIQDTDEGYNIIIRCIKGE